MKMFKYIITIVIILTLSLRYSYTQARPYTLNARFSDKNTIWVVGMNGLILNSPDKGITWKSFNSNTTNVLYSILHINNGKDFIVGDNGMILISNNKGNSWKYYMAQWYEPLHSIAAIDTNILIICGEHGTILRSENNGDNWTKIEYDVKINLNKIIATANNNFIIAGDNGVLLLSADKGKTWINKDTLSNQNIYCVSSNANGLCAAAGENCGIYISRDFGTSWINVKSQFTNNDLDDIKVLQTGVIIAVGANGIILRSSDFGASWLKINSNTNYDISSVDFIGTYGIAPIAIDNALYTYDAGITWNNMFGFTNNKVNDISKVNKINDFSLERNYPNPFNPTTKITYKLSDISNVNLSVYDVLGKLIICLVNTSQSAGVYSYSFDGSNVAGGIYFCRININNENNKTIRMILNK